MIKVTRLNGQLIVLNADLIEFVEVTPDTVITLTTGQKLVVSETAEEVINKVVEFRRAILAGTLGCPAPACDEKPEEAADTPHG